MWGSLTRAERRVKEAIAAGSVADLSDLNDKAIRADILLKFCCESTARWRVAPEGVRVQNGKIIGQLRFSNRKLSCPLWIRDSDVADGIDLTNSQTKTIDLSRSRLGEIMANQLRLDGDMICEDAQIRGCFHLSNAVIEGQFLANRATFDNSASDAIEAQGSVSAGFFLDSARLEGTCNINGATIKGPFSAVSATFRRVDGTAINAQSLRCAGFHAETAEIYGTCDISGANVEGQFFANNARFEHPTGDAINAQECEMQGFFVNGSTVVGVCDINNSTIDGHFEANGANFSNPTGNAIRADAARIGSLFMRSDDGEATQVSGTIDLIRAHIKHDLHLRGISISGAQYVAIAARGLLVEGSAHIDEGSRVDGAIHFGGADIRGRLKLTGSKITSAMLARRRPDQPMPAVSDQARNDRSASWDAYAIDLSEAKVGHLLLPDTAETRPRGIIELSRARVGTFTDFKAAWPPQLNRWNRHYLKRPCDDAGRDADHLCLDGFEYEHLDNPDGLPIGDIGPVAKARIDWLHGQSRDDLFERLRPQPWRQLGKVLAQQGYEDDARSLSIERRVAQRYAKGMPAAARTLSWMLHQLADYGFNPWKTVGWSALLVLLFALVYFGAAYDAGSPDDPLAFNQKVFVQTLAADFTPGAQSMKEAQERLRELYPRFDPLMYSLDVFLPFVDLGIEKYWRVNTITQFGKLLYYLSVLEGIVGAVLVSLTVTGFTGLLTRDER